MNMNNHSVSDLLKSSMTVHDAPGCLYCGGRDLHELYSGVRDRLGHVDGVWSFRTCIDCGSALIHPFPQADELVRFYPPVYSFAPELGRKSLAKKWWSRFEQTVLYDPMYASDARRILRHTADNHAAGRKLLDLGCGRGLRLLAFRRLGYEVFGTDFQPEIVQYVREQLGIAAVCAQIDSLPTVLGAGSFDVVTAYYLLEHVLDVVGTLRICHRLLKPGGWLAAAVPLVDSAQSRLFRGRWSQITEAPRHVSIPSQVGLRMASELAGFGNARIIPDSIRVSVASATLSLFPSATTYAAYATERWRPLAARISCLAAAPIALPCCWLESFVLERPAVGILLAQRPVGPATSITI